MGREGSHVRSLLLMNVKVNILIILATQTLQSISPNSPPKEGCTKVNLQTTKQKYAKQHVLLFSWHSQTPNHT